jgi:hypothetical protein
MTDSPRTKVGQELWLDRHATPGPVRRRTLICHAEEGAASQARKESEEEVRRLREALNVALNQWRSYADEHPDRLNGTWPYLDEPTSPGDEESAMFAEARAALAPTPTTEPER